MRKRGEKEILGEERAKLIEQLKSGIKSLFKMDINFSDGKISKYQLNKFVEDYGLDDEAMESMRFYKRPNGTIRLSFYSPALGKIVEDVLITPIKKERHRSRRSSLWDIVIFLLYLLFRWLIISLWYLFKISVTVVAIFIVINIVFHPKTMASAIEDILKVVGALLIIYLLEEPVAELLEYKISEGDNVKITEDFIKDAPNYVKDGRIFLIELSDYFYYAPTNKTSRLLVGRIKRYRIKDIEDISPSKNKIKLTMKDRQVIILSPKDAIYTISTHRHSQIPYTYRNTPIKNLKKDGKDQPFELVYNKMSVPAFLRHIGEWRWDLIKDLHDTFSYFDFSPLAAQIELDRLRRW